MSSLHVLVLYLSTVLAAIAPHMGQTRRDSIAGDIAKVALSEDRVFGDDASGQKTALLLVSIAHYETGKSWATWVDDGRCNDIEWRNMHAEWLRGGGCDHGNAYSIFQVHPPGDDPRIGKLYATNRRMAASAALFIARKSIQAGVGLCGYTGETYPNCPKAQHRLEAVATWATKYPFSPAVAELASEQ